MNKSLSECTVICQPRVETSQLRHSRAIHLTQSSQPHLGHSVAVILNRRRIRLSGAQEQAQGKELAEEWGQRTHSVEVERQ